MTENNLQSYELFNENSQTFFYNLKAKPVQRMLDFDYLSGRNIPSVAAIIHPGRSGFHKAFFGGREILIPLYGTIDEAVQKHPNVDSITNFASFRSSYAASKEALETQTIKVVTIVAEGIPERQMKELIAIAKQRSKTIIGAATVGAMVGGKFRVGHAGGMNENIIRAKLHRPGSVGLVSKSGGMMNEFFNIISRTTDGIYEGVAIGGDVFAGSTLLEHILRFEKNPNIKMIFCLGELGGRSEYEIAQAKKEGKITKPLIMWVSGTSAEIFPWQVQFGHAGAKANKADEGAAAKNNALREAGIIVPENFEHLEEVMHAQYQSLVERGVIVPEEKEAREIPARKKTSMISTISSDLGEEPTYNGVPMSELIESNASVGKVIGHLWFKKDLPNYFVKFIDMCLVICADHGPAVATAHNAIVAARAGKDIVSSLVSGLMTVGTRHGGAIDGGARYIKAACDSGKNAFDFVEEMKGKGIRIPGIGHRVKSVKNPDKRVELLKKFARAHFPSHMYLDYALEVEKVTLQKADNLILNVDGCIAALFLDAMHAGVSSGLFSEQEISEIVAVGYMNGLFALSRSIGMIGHVLDQKRMNEPLYRHDTSDILYLDGEN